MFDVSDLGSKPAPRRRKARRSYPHTQKIVAFLASRDLRLGYDTLSRVALALGEAKPTDQSDGQRGASICGSLPPALQPYVCRGGNDEERVGSYHAKAKTRWAEAGLENVREDLETLPVVRKHQADDLVSRYLEAVDVDPETGEPAAPEAEEGADS